MPGVGGRESRDLENGHFFKTKKKALKYLDIIAMYIVIFVIVGSRIVKTRPALALCSYIKNRQSF